MGNVAKIWPLPTCRGELRRTGAVVRALVRLWPELISSTSCQSQLPEGTAAKPSADCAEQCTLSSAAGSHGRATQENSSVSTTKIRSYLIKAIPDFYLLHI